MMERPEDVSGGNGPSPLPGGADPDRDDAVLELAYQIALEEVAEANRIFEASKARISVVFGAVVAALAFLLGSTLSSRDPESLELGYVYLGIGSFVVFGIATFVGLMPTSRKLHLNGRGVMDDFVQSNQQTDSVTHRWPLRVVKWQIIHDADAITSRNVAAVRLLQWMLRVMLVSASVSILMFALLLAYSSPVAG